MYFTDSRAGAIYAFDFDLDSGAIANRRVFAQVPAEAGRADGLTVDREGLVWSAHWDGGCVTGYRPDGSIAHRIRLPAPLLTSCTFGGADLDQLFVTSARWDMDADALAKHPYSGSVFAVRTGTTGFPETPFAG
jgi:sugar lactone lactonase YvrE